MFLLLISNYDKKDFDGLHEGSTFISTNNITHIKSKS